MKGKCSMSAAPEKHFTILNLAREKKRKMTSCATKTGSKTFINSTPFCISTT